MPGKSLLPLTLAAALLWAGAAAAKDPTFKLEAVEPVAGQPLKLRGTFKPAGKIIRARARYRTSGQKDFRPVDLVRTDGDVWEAAIDGANVQLPALEFFVVAQPKGGKPALVLGSPDQPVSLPVNQPTVDEPEDPGFPEELSPPESANPLETAEERELRTGERAGGGTLGSSRTLLRRTRPQPTDLRVDDVSPDDPEKLQEEFAVFAAEDATAIAATYAQRTRTAPAIITVFGRAQIEQMRARTLLDILKLIPGFETSKTVLGFDEVAIRGIRSDPEILLLIDGHRVANIYDGRIPWAVPAEIIERVEVIRGPGSAIYGTGAFLGVVNVVTREHEHVYARVGTTMLKPSPFLTNGKTSPLPRYASPDPYNPDNDPGAIGLFAPEASVAGGANVFGLKAYGSGYARVSRGQRMPVANDSFTDTGIERPPEALHTDAREAKTALTAKVDYAPPFLKGGHGFARTFFQYEDRGPYFGVFDTLGPRSQLAWILGTTDVGYAQPFLDGGEVLVRFYGDGHWVDRRLQLTPDAFSTVDRNGDGKRETWPHGVAARNMYISTTGGAEARLLLPQIFRHRLNVGVQAEGNFIPFFRFTLNRDANGVALNTLQPPPSDSIPQKQNLAWRLGGALYVQDEWQVTDRLYTTLGLRANLFSDVKWDPRTHITPRAAVVFEPIDDLAIKVLYGAAFRAPTFEEKYDQTSLSYADFSPGVFIGNERLEPEYIQTAESGVDYSFTLAGFKYRVAGNAFYSFIGNSIDRIDESGSREPVRNRGFRHVMGSEAEARVEFATNTYIYGNVGWHRGWFVEPDATETRRLDWLDPTTYVDAIANFPNAPEETKVSYLTTVPQYRANLGGNVELFELVNFHADLMLGSERRNNVRSTLERLRAYRIPAYALLNVGFRTRPLLGWVGFEGNVYNALDYDYRDDVPRPDRVKELLPREGMTVLLGIYLSH